MDRIIAPVGATQAERVVEAPRETNPPTMGVSLARQTRRTAWDGDSPHLLLLRRPPRLAATTAGWAVVAFVRERDVKSVMEYTGQAASRFAFAEILYDKKDGIARVTLNRPEVYNAYSSDTLREMTEAFRDASMDDGVGVLVLTGAGDKAFCAGSDAKEFSSEFLHRPRNFWKFQGLLAEALSLFRHLGKPTIARLNGVVAGAGNDWNLAADLAIAADHVRLMQMGTRVGLVDAWGATQWLPLMIGDRRAREMLLTCDEVTAEQALNWGLVNQVVPLKQLDRAVNALAKS